MKQVGANLMRTSGPAPEPERHIAEPRPAAATATAAAAAAAAAAAGDKHDELRRLEAALKAVRDEKESALAAKAEAEAQLQALRGEHRRLNDTITAAQTTVQEVNQRFALEQTKFSADMAGLELQIREAKGRKPQGGGGAPAAAELEAESQRLRAQISDLRQADEAARARAQRCLAGLGEVVRANDEHNQALQEALFALDSLYAYFFASLGFDPKREGAVAGGK